MLAAQKGHHDVFRYLHSKGADTTLTDCDGDHFLCMACVGGNMDIVEYVVLKEPTLINRQRNDGRTSLMWAAWLGKRPVFRYLIKKGADPSLMDQHGDNILHYAAHQGQIDIVKDIITNTTTDIDSGDICGKTALTMAAEAGHTDTFDFLVRTGCKTSHTDGNGNNILHLACRGGHAKIVEHILSRKDIDINCRGQYGETPQMMAAFYGHRDVYDLLHEKGADAEIVDNKQNNILHMACMEGHVEIVKDILIRGLLDINSHGQNGRTPLMLAAWMERSEVFVLLLHKMSDLLQVDHEGNNILHLACEKGCMEIVQKVLLQNSLDINDRNGHGETASMVAERKHHMELYKLLVSR